MVDPLIHFQLIHSSIHPALPTYLPIMCSYRTASGRFSAASWVNYLLHVQVLLSVSWISFLFLFLLPIFSLLYDRYLAGYLVGEFVSSGWYSAVRCRLGQSGLLVDYGWFYKVEGKRGRERTIIACLSYLCLGWVRLSASPKLTRHILVVTFSLLFLFLFPFSLPFPQWDCTSSGLVSILVVWLVGFDLGGVGYRSKLVEDLKSWDWYCLIWCSPEKDEI